MYVRFIASDSGAQFSATYFIQCGVVFRWANALEFKSVDRDGDGIYDNNLNCTWTIIGKESDKVQLTITSMDIQVDEHCDHDFLKVGSCPSLL